MHILNPYQGVDWSKSFRCKANFHCHTKLHKLLDNGKIIPNESDEFASSDAVCYGSDGPDYPPAVIDRYRSYGFDILSITDHDPFYGYGPYQESYSEKTVFPWTRWALMKPSLQMIAIEGKELTNPHGGAMEHDVSLFCSVGKTDQHKTGYHRIERLQKVKKAGGLMVLCHPRGHVTAKQMASQAIEYEESRLMEVFTRAASTDARAFWDEVLCICMPEHPVWGVSCDDMHQFSELGTNYSMHWLASKDEKAVRHSLIQGEFYACMDPLGNDSNRHNDEKAPQIKKVSVSGSCIRLTARNTKNIRWISCANAVDEGEQIDVALNGAKKYIRAELIGDQGAISLTQPFGIVDS